MKATTSSALNSPPPAAPPAATTTVPLVVCAAAILTLSSLPGSHLPQIASLWQLDKLAHFAQYTILAALTVRYFHLRRRLPLNPSVKTALIGCLLFAFFDELHQLWIPLRHCTWQDMAANSAGVLAGTLGGRVLLAHKGRSCRP